MRALGLTTVVLAGVAFLFGLIALAVGYPLSRILFFLENLCLVAAIVLAGIGLMTASGGQPAPAGHGAPQAIRVAGGAAYAPSYAPQVAVAPISKGLFLGFMIGGVLLSFLLLVPLVFIFFEGRGRDREIVTMLLCPAILPSLCAAILQMILVYRMWAAIQGGRARATPGQALGFLFIPFFNLYWVFQAYWGWTRDYNQYAAERGLAVPRMPAGLAMTICILLLASIIPFLNFVILPINLILLLIFFNSCINGVNALAASAPGSGS